MLVNLMTVIYQQACIVMITFRIFLDILDIPSLQDSKTCHITWAFIVNLSTSSEVTTS